MTDDNTVSNVTAVAAKLYETLQEDLPTLRVIDNYLRGDHPEPYMPDQADAEYKLLAKRAVTNWCPLLVDTPSQALYVDGFRRGALVASSAKHLSRSSLNRRDLPEWVHWEESRMQSRQDAVIRGALGYGHSFVLTEMKGGKVLSRGLSPLRTSALFEDPANDDNAIAVLTVAKHPKGDTPGAAILWDRTNRYDLTFDREGKWLARKKAAHGTPGENPVTRFAAAVDLEGRTTGVVEPYLAVQDRINQTVFDLLIAQTGSSFETRWATGMAPPLQRDENGDPVLDDNGQPIPLPINLNAKKFLIAEDGDASFGTLAATPLGPYVEAIDLAVRHLSALSQTPPHHLLGQIANLSAEALQAAETALSRKVDNFKAVFGESWERVFRIALRLSGTPGHEDMTGTVMWRDMGPGSLAQNADALGKLAESLGIPKRGLWDRVDGVTQGEIATWEALYEEESTDLGTLRSPLSGRRQETTATPEEDVNGDEPVGEGSPGD